MLATDILSSPGPAEHASAWLRLALTPGLGRRGARALLGHFGSPLAVLQAGQAALARLLAPALACALSQAASAAVAAQVARAEDWLALPGNHLLTMGDPAFPAALAAIPDPPFLLYARGRLELLGRRTVAVVGSRNASAQGVANAEAFGAALSAAGLAIASGLALGIDAAAHRGGLRGPGSTVAVVGTGLDLCYPERNRALAAQIAEQGCLLSEYPLGAPPRAPNFPVRNRIISGLARGVLVVEAAARSGSLITAHVALEQGRDVYAIPGSIHSALSKGCHALIREGATLVESAADILAEMDLRPAAAPAPALGAAEEGLLAGLGHDPFHADHVSERNAMDAAATSAALLLLELAGQIERLPGGMFQRLHP